MTDERFAHDAFFVDQLIRPVANLYRISVLAPGDLPGEPVAFVRQKKLAIKEDIRFFADENESQELIRLKARQVVDVRGRYDVTTPAGERLGVLERRFGESLFRTAWRVLDAAEQEVAVARESNTAVALIRRFVDVPIPYHFAIQMDGRDVGELRRLFALRDRYTLKLGGDHERRIDRRVAVALAVALDALQSR